MKKFIKWVAIIVAGLVLCAAGAYTYFDDAASKRLAQTWPEVKGKDLVVPMPLTPAEVASVRTALIAKGVNHGGQPLAVTVGEDGSKKIADPLAGADLQAIALKRAIERGKYLATIRLGCSDCHGDNFAGKLIADAQPVMTFRAPNVTLGGLTKKYTPSDWDRIIRHGIKPDNTNAIMPAIDYMALSDAEVSDVIAYVTSLPAVDRVEPDTTFGPIGRVLLGTGKMPIAAEQIDHTASKPKTAPVAAVNATYGKHIAQTCVGCHRAEMNGGPIAAGDPKWPDASNLTKAGPLKGWNEADFIKTMKTGTRPDGTTLNPVAMPWPVLGKMTDQDLRALWAYLTTLQPVATGT
ncbi:MAG: cytochrome c [Myxococcota bacterium]|nr:cytochrome c [Myxococcota bacterium]